MLQVLKEDELELRSLHTYVRWRDQSSHKDLSNISIHIEETAYQCNLYPIYSLAVTRWYHVRLRALIPRSPPCPHGLQVAVFAAASESFSRANINCSVEESLDRFKPLLEKAALARLPVRGYVSCVLGCPYEGHVSPDDVAKVSARIALGRFDFH